jgi:hypothetical protein
MRKETYVTKGLVIFGRRAATGYVTLHIQILKLHSFYYAF